MSLLLLPIMRNIKCTFQHTRILTNNITEGCKSYCSSSAPPASHPEEDDKLHCESPMSENDIVNLAFVNRNPRNLELLGLARKRKGWKFQYPSKTFYHRLIYDLTLRHLTVRVEDSKGNTVVQASTREFCIAKHLYSYTDICASANIGRILALRCLRSGISNMVLLPPEIGEESQKFSEFLKAIEEGGIELTEPEEYVKPYVPGVDYDNQQQMQDMYERQMKVADLGREHFLIKTWRRRKGRNQGRVPMEPRSVYDAVQKFKPYNENEG